MSLLSRVEAIIAAQSEEELANAVMLGLNGVEKRVTRKRRNKAGDMEVVEIEDTITQRSSIAAMVLRDRIEKKAVSNVPGGKELTAIIDEEVKSIGVSYGDKNE